LNAMSEIHGMSAVFGSGSENKNQFAEVPDSIGGFNFENCRRNQFIEASDGIKGKLPGFRKTGTTIVGVVFEGGIVLGADTRATEGSIIADKNCEKIHYMAPNIFCCGAGTAADTENTTGMVASQLELLRLRTGTQSRVVTAMTVLKRELFKYQGQVSAALVLGGCDCTGAHLYTIYPHGSTDKLPYVTMGSGSLAAMAVFEEGYKDGLTEEEGKELVKNAILSGIFNDLGSGGNVDLCVIRKNGAEEAQMEMFRNIETPNDGGLLRAQVKKPSVFDFPAGCTAVLSESFTPHTVPSAPVAMEN